jgi:DNA-binding transcriptional regulator YdaS (Cro superfamily)
MTKRKPMSATALREIATVAFGPEWKQALADKLGCTRESVWRYATNRTAIPAERAGAILVACGTAIAANMKRERKTLERIGALILR